MVDGVKDVIWMNELLKEIGENTGTVEIYNDNTSAIKLMKNPENHRRSKHVEVKYHFIRGQQKEKKIEVKHIETENKPADILTNHLSEEKIERCMNNAIIMYLKHFIMMVMTILTISTVNGVFQSAPPLVQREQRDQPIIKGTKGFVYDLRMSTSCVRFIGNNSPEWCKELYQRNIISTVKERCKSQLQTRYKRFDPITIAISVTAIVGVVTLTSDGLSVANSMKTRDLE